MAVGAVGASGASLSLACYVGFNDASNAGHSLLEKIMTKEMFMDIVRTAMKVLGGVVLASEAAKAGGLDAGGWSTLTGAALVMAGLFWSWWSTYHLTK